MLTLIKVLHDNDPLDFIRYVKEKYIPIFPKDFLEQSVSKEWFKSDYKELILEEGRMHRGQGWHEPFHLIIECKDMSLHMVQNSIKLWDGKNMWKISDLDDSLADPRFRRNFEISHKPTGFTLYRLPVRWTYQKHKNL